MSPPITVNWFAVTAVLPITLLIFIFIFFIQGILITPDELDILSNPLPLISDGSASVTLASVEFFVQRWNNTQMYDSMGITSLRGLPPGWDENFFPAADYNAELFAR